MRLSPLLALQGVFAMNSLALALWLPRIPDVRAALDLDYTTLSYCLLCLPAGLMIGFMIAPGTMQRLGQRMVCILAGGLYPLMMIPPAFAPSAVLLGLALFAAGLVMSHIEVAMNAKANAIQDALGRRIMSRCHAFWSIGAMLGGLIAGVLATRGWSLPLQQSVVETCLAVFAVLFAIALPKGKPGTRSGKRERIVVPRGVLALLCVLPFGALIVEGTMLDWSALYVVDILEGSSLGGSLVFSTFAIAMGVGRMAGDHITERLGLLPVLTLSGVALILGILIFVLPGSLPFALIGAIIAGFGSANVYPLAMSLAHRAPGVSPEVNVATLAFVSFTVFLVGPPMIGILADFLGLDVAFLALLPFAAISILIARSGQINDQTETPS